MGMEEILPVVPEKYFDVTRLDDGRYRVVFVKHGAVPRASYTSRVSDVVTQALRVGGVPVRTRDEAVQRACFERQVEIME
jgi:hypothetical protein